jgi:hypothetical protein
MSEECAVDISGDVYAACWLIQYAPTDTQFLVLKLFELKAAGFHTPYFGKDFTNSGIHCTHMLIFE